MSELRDFLAMHGFSRASAEAASPPWGALSALEAALDGPAAAAQEARAAAASQLARMDARLRKALQAGVKPQDFATLQAVRAACEAAQAVLDCIGVPDDGVASNQLGHSASHKGVIP
ncbi:EscE/YscE/SsaE family type III secretion system needle protein co-chaperone [Comamonas sp. NLF-1-9]|uniref:EscE/YscE/SsaE family type III secretion system needle protein co-chaperone n=1 Tax=Comamonas sp. NLF-1-9 TaxID=2853163 RepID=UPI001C43D13C|nr:EscE/YscE/SsaE family type III secretion system needle protein co-chaperone [Comamonas sp. NLF-1-9]QXL83608.1 EscE/YscE/SsaE family type III secretion system needle protein co-chaperone [Comamonas sp. NLF-1-9]